MSTKFSGKASFGWSWFPSIGGFETFIRSPFNPFGARGQGQGVVGKHSFKGSLEITFQLLTGTLLLISKGPNCPGKH